MFGARNPICSKVTQHLLNQGWRVIIPRTTYRIGEKGGAFNVKLDGPGEYSFKTGKGQWGVNEHKSFQIANTGQLLHKHEVEYDNVDKCRQAIGDSSMVGIYINSAMRDAKWQDY